MRFSITLTLLAALAPTTLFAAPTNTLKESTKLAKREYSVEACDLSAVSLPTAPTPLPAPNGTTLSHIAVGRGTQNYTCASTPNDASATPKSGGALASLYNVTCLSALAPEVLSDLSTIGLALPSNAQVDLHVDPKTKAVTIDNTTADGPVTGHHLFTSSMVPFFETSFGTVHGKLVANSTAPTGSAKGKNGLGSVAWLKLVGTEGGDFKEIYRVETAGGVADKDCSQRSGAFEVEYAALYWFYK